MVDLLDHNERKDTLTKYKLGKKPPVIDGRDLKLSRYFTPLLPPPPLECNWQTRISKWPMLANDRYGDCAIVSHAHQLLMQTTLTDGVAKAYQPSLPEVIKAYSAISGFDPRTGANDNGCVMLDCLKYFRNVGLAGRKIAGYARVNIHDNQTLMQAIYLFGGVYVGLSLPLAAQQMKLWKAPVAPANRVGIYAPGSWGGHSVGVFGYNADGHFFFPTWSKVQECTLVFKEAYMDEGFVIITQDWLDDKGKSPSGLDINALNADLQSVGK